MAIEDLAADRAIAQHDKLDAAGTCYARWKNLRMRPTWMSLRTGGILAVANMFLTRESLEEVSRLPGHRLRKEN